MGLERWDWYVLLQMEGVRRYLNPSTCRILDEIYEDIAPRTMDISSVKSNNHISRWTSWKLDPAKLDSLMQTESKGKEALCCAVDDFKAIKNEILETKFFACGKKGVLYTGESNSNPILLIKVQKLNEHNSIDKESKWIEKLNRFNIGPKMYMSGRGYMMCEFLEGGVHAIEFLLHPNAREMDISWFIRRIFHQCYVLDVLGINKAEMTHPMRHIIVYNSSCVFIDFEKCTYGVQPRNVTQLCQFICSPRVVQALTSKGIPISVQVVREHAKRYKESPSSKTFDRLLKVFTIPSHESPSN